MDSEDLSFRELFAEKLADSLAGPLPELHYEVTYLRVAGDHEVDFMARGPEGELELIQACADASSETTAERELRALTEAQDRFPNATCRLLTATRSTSPKKAPPDVIVQPGAEWFLMGMPEA